MELDGGSPGAPPPSRTGRTAFPRRRKVAGPVLEVVGAPSDPESEDPVVGVV
jgi:hypothetical protein